MTFTLEKLIADAREGAGKLAGREALTEYAVGAAFLLAAGAMAIVLPWEPSLDPVVVLLLVVALAGASRVHLEDGTGHTDPSQVVLIPMLYFLPCPLVPL